MATDKERIKKILFKASRRGIKELDLLLAPAIKEYLETKSNISEDQTYEAIERLMESPEPQIMDWLINDTFYPLFASSNRQHEDVLKGIWLISNNKNTLNK